MGIWIRSQNKVVLIRADNIWVDGEAIFANYVGDIHTWLGDYDSEAEAIQVLDMIQTHIVKIDDYHRTGCYEDWVDPVFQMPPAGFSEPEKKQVAKLEQDLDLYKEALAIVLDSYEYVNCDNCPLREGCSRREATAICISDLRDYFLEEARKSIAKAERGGE